MSVELKPCPFCGGKAKIVEIFAGICVVGCENCLSMTGNHETREQAIEAWNRRTEK